MAGMEGGQGWEMRKSEHLDSQTTAPCLCSSHVVYWTGSLITGPRADGQIQKRRAYLMYRCGANDLLAPISQPRFQGAQEAEHEGGGNPCTWLGRLLRSQISLPRFAGR